MPIGREEEIVRAICSDKFDGERFSPSLFSGKDTSVSRLSMIELEEHWEMFRVHVQKPPERWLERIGQINVGVLQDIGSSHETPMALTVESKPEDWNPAHAEVPQKISRGLATKIVNALRVHIPPSGFRERNRAG